jgi:hypothetical protein
VKLLTLVLLVLGPLLGAQDLDDFVRRANESALDYVMRVKPATDVLTFRVLETYEWDARTPSLVAFYQVARDSEDASEVVGHVYMKQYDVDYYRDIVFGKFLGEGEYPEIVDAFWRNVDKDKDTELLVLFRYFTRHYDFTGYVYDLAVLDHPTIDSDALEPLDLFGDTFVSFEGMSGEGVESTPTYATKDAVVRKLKQLGR